MKMLKKVSYRSTNAANWLL